MQILILKVEKMTLWCEEPITRVLRRATLFAWVSIGGLPISTIEDAMKGGLILPITTAHRTHQFDDILSS